MGSPRDQRLQLDVSMEAKQNLRILADMDERSMGFTLDKILTEYPAELAAQMFGGNHSLYKEEFTSEKAPEAEA